MVATLSVDRTRASQLLSRWTRQGWLRRVAHGAYVSASLDLLDSAQVLDDPWVLVPALYGPAYVGGRTAAEHWDLTEQLFRDIVVMTARPVRDRRQVRHGAHFTLHHIHERRIFGTRPVWRGQSRVLVSDVHRTMVDMCDDPARGGGTQHVADCLRAYLKHEDRNDETLIEYAETLGNGAVFKRLGFLLEEHAEADGLREDCRTRLTQGNARLDPALDCTRLASRCRLWVPPSWVSEQRA